MFESTLGTVGFLAARVLFAVILGYLALGNLLDYEATVGYARSKGAPLPGLSVVLGSLLLLAGALAILFGAYPGLGAAAVVLFLVAITPIMHDFWSFEGQDAQNEQIHFMKNVGLMAGALVFLSLAGAEWPYSVAMSL